ncbi:hypothetical protein Nmel_008138 [Mimus melanotis]
MKNAGRFLFVTVLFLVLLLQ